MYKMEIPSGGSPFFICYRKPATNEKAASGY